MPTTAAAAMPEPIPATEAWASDPPLLDAAVIVVDPACDDLIVDEG